MNVWQITDTGLVRKNNQDACGVVQLDDAIICVVCDGMGGTAGGQVASQLAVDAFLEHMKTHYKGGLTPEEVVHLGKKAVEAANLSVHQEAQHSEQYHNMGTTLVAAVVQKDQAVLWNVGDSRAYQVNKNGIRQITKDHSFVETLVESGELTQEEARVHPKRNYITRALGPDAMVLCDGYVEALSNQDYLLLCTDGLDKTVDDQEILFEIIHGNTLETCLERLVTIAKGRGAPDNVTAVLVQPGDEGRLD